MAIASAVLLRIVLFIRDPMGPLYGMATIWLESSRWLDRVHGELIGTGRS